MGKQLVWEERFNIGVDFIDKEHKKLFAILNKILANRKEEEKSQWVCQEGIKFFKEHAVKHFAEEEAYMESIHYVNFETHKRLHDDFRKNTLPALEKEMEQTLYSIESINHFLGVCVGWMLGHTLTEDRAITEKTAGRQDKLGKLMSNEEQAAMIHIIMQLLNDMFQLEPKVISECYGGEKFGNGIYHRMAFGAKNGERWEVILALEEKLIMETVGSMINADANTLNEMIMNAARFISQQFVSRISERFQSKVFHEMKEENLLTYDQFKKVFERQQPQYSLLFGTEKGYMAFCVIAPHLFESGEGIAEPISAENALSQVRKYLDNNKASSKKRILVVDDSDFALQAMHELLGKDYEITTAKSGLSAIRCITLSRPDLVLLDYEMPVCSGSQVLEMIRAEEDFANIPVIFLTGRSDRESVKKVIALKPAGYLVKTQAPEEIRKGIDTFFAQQNG